MPIGTGPYQVIVGLLLIAGVAKLARPGPTAEVARVAGLPLSSSIVRVFALAEVVAAVAAFSVGGRLTAAAVAALYAVFAGFVLMLRVRGIETAGCGCFGQETDEPPGGVHIAVDVVAALIAVVAIVWPVADIAAVLAEQPLGGVPYVGFLVMGIWLVMVVLTDLPRLANLMAEAQT